MEGLPHLLKFAMQKLQKKNNMKNELIHGYIIERYFIPYRAKLIAHD